MRKIIIIGITLLISQLGYAQVGIGTSTPHSSSILDVSSPSKGFLPPRISSDSQISSPTEGLTIYDISDKCINVYTGSAWVNLCAGNSGTGGGTTTNTELHLSCEDVYSDLLTFGNDAIQYSGIHNGTFQKFSAHLSSDGSYLYSNTGQYYDTSYDKVARNTNGMVSATTQMLAINQLYPSKKWKDFYLLDVPNSHWPGIVYLLSDDGELHSVALSEHTSNSHQLHLRSNLIGGTDNSYTYDPNISNSNTLDISDYRLQPYQHLVDDTDASIKFSSFYGVGFKQGSSGMAYSIFTYDNVNHKFYSMGVNTSSGWIHSSMNNNSLLRKSSTASSLKESIIIREADKINAVIAHYGTNFDEGNGVDLKFTNFNYSNTVTNNIFAFITTDGFVNAIWNNTVYRLQLPTGVKAKSLSGSITSPVLGDDGNVYRLSTNWLSSSSSFNTSSVSIPNLGTMTEATNASAAVLAYTNTALNNLDIKQFISTSDYRYMLSETGQLYTLNNSNVFVDRTTTYSLPLIQEILSAGEDAIVKGTDGVVFAVSHNGNLKDDIPVGMFTNAIGIDGRPILSSEMNTNRVRLLYNCFGN